MSQRVMSVNKAFQTMNTEKLYPTETNEYLYTLVIHTKVTSDNVQELPISSSKRSITCVVSFTRSRFLLFN